MEATTKFTSTSVEKIVERIFTFRQLSRIDQRLLISHFLAKDSLTEKDSLQINRVFDAVQKGSIRVVE